MLPSDINPIEAKDAFAAASLRWPNDPFKAAQLVFPHHISAAVFIMQTWLLDPYVMAKKEALLKEHGAEEYLPSKYELAHDVYHTARHTSDVEAKIKAYKLFADIQGYVSKPSEAANVNVAVTTQVLVVEQYSPAQIEEAQTQLLLEAAADAN